MAFVPRTFLEILNDMIAYVQTRTALSDFTPGSVIRTMLEAAAIEDDEQYFQMVQLLDLFSINTSTGADLDRRMADYGLFREQPKTAFGKSRFSDTGLKTNTLAIDAPTSSVSLELFDSTKFPVAGFPYTVRVSEGSAAAEDVLVTANNTAGGILTLDATTPLSNALTVGTRVSLVTGAVSRTIAAGTLIESPATVATTTKKFSTSETASIIAGNLFSNEVLTKANQAGELGNTGVGTVNRFSGGSPFSGAAVTNVTPIQGGVVVESDKNFRERGLSQLQSLARGTPLALKSSSIGVEDPETGQRVNSANIIEDFTRNEVIVYIDDGTGFSPDSTPLGASNIQKTPQVDSTDTVLEVEDGSSFPTAGTILIQADGTNQAELISYTTKDNNTLTLVGSLASDHLTNTVVRVVDVVTSGAEVNQRRFNLHNFPARLGTDVLFSKGPAGTWRVMVRDTDYFLNHGTGEIQITDPGGFSTGTQLVANYTYYTNLIAQVQRVLEGDAGDPNSYPGVKAAGVLLRVEAPHIARFDIRAVLTAEEGFREEDLSGPVRRAIEDYVNSRRIGQDIIISKMVDLAHDITGVRDVNIVEPTSNVVVLEDQKPVAFDAFGTSLVTVT